MIYPNIPLKTWLEGHRIDTVDTNKLGCHRDGCKEEVTIRPCRTKDMVGVELRCACEGPWSLMWIATPYTETSKSFWNAVIS